MVAAVLAAVALAAGWAPATGAADRYADGRRGTIAYAVRTEGRLRGRHLDVRVALASVVKALLLVAYLRDERVRDRPLGRADRRLLGP